jgi:hypothetical protein
MSEKSTVKGGKMMKTKKILTLTGLVLLLVAGMAANVYANFGEPGAGEVKSGPAIVGVLTLDIVDSTTGFFTFTARIEGCCADCYAGGVKCSANIKHTLGEPLGVYINDTNNDGQYNFNDIAAADLIGMYIPAGKDTPKQCYSREGNEAMEISDAFDIVRSEDGMHMTAKVVLLYWVVK